VIERRVLGRGGPAVSTLALGTMGFGGRAGFQAAGQAGLEEARRQVDLCLAAGVNLVDTADIYSDGDAETILGQAIAGRRDEVVLATKVGGRTGPGPQETGLSRRHVAAGCEASLRRLGTDRIDLYQVHRWDPLVPLEETLAALERLVQDGKVLHVGCSNFAAWQLMKALALSEREGLARFRSQQIYYSLVAREAENELLPLAASEGVGVIVWSPLAGGFLSGKYHRGQPPPEGSRRAAWGDPGAIDEERGYAVLDVLGEIAAEHGKSVAQVALRWLIEQEEVTSVVVGARTEEQLRANLAAAELALSPGEVERLRLVSEPPPLYPYWHQAQET
jgi:aryl-alcohol dehydrogenase-like predicted oxidoreductase